MTVSIVTLVVFTLFFTFCLDSCLSNQRFSKSNNWRTRNHKEIRDVDPFEYLERFGYLQAHGHQGQQLHHQRLERKSAITLYQKMNNLKVTGKLNRQTTRIMRKSRCGNPDIDIYNHGNGRRRKREANGQVGAAFNLPGNKWKSKNLTWKLSVYSNKLYGLDQERTLQKIFNMWSEVSPLKIQPTHYQPDIDISFARYSHGDGHYNAFDGKGMMLAHAYGPGQTKIAGDIHFDNDEDWALVENRRRKHTKDFFAAALHEAGHTLGLPHSTNKQAVMYPIYKGFEPNLRLDLDDVTQLQNIYGVDPKFKYIPKKNNETPEKSANRVVNTPKECRVKIKAIFYDSKIRRTYLLTSSKIYRLNQNGLDRGFPVPTRNLLMKAPHNPQAAVYVPEFNRVFIFKGSKVWRYTNMKLDEGYPKRIESKIPDGPVTAVNMRDRRGRSRVFLFGKKYFWSWNYQSERIGASVMSTNSYWRDFPQDIDAALLWKDGMFYVFAGQKYYKISMYSRKVLPGYPKSFGPAWIGRVCGVAIKK